MFLSLVRLGIGKDSIVSVPETIDWHGIKKLAEIQGLSAIVLDGINELSEAKRPSKEIVLNWIGEVLQNYEGRYTLYEKAISSLAEFNNRHGYKVMVLKGYACSLDWPKPNHRPCGDIDIWQFGHWKEADAALAKEKGIKIDYSHHHHTVFFWGDFMVENHYDFVNVHHSKSNAKLERMFKELGDDDSQFVEINGQKVYLPPSNLHALFLLRHAMIEFAATGINLRQLLDWGFFAQKHKTEIDWNWLEDILEQFGMKRLYDVFNAICVGDLGFDVTIFPRAQFDPILKDKVLSELLSPSVSNEIPKKFFSRVVWKWKRWKANEWKHDLVYKESMWSAFWGGVWNHLLKPCSI